MSEDQKNFYTYLYSIWQAVSLRIRCGTS